MLSDLLLVGAIGGLVGLDRTAAGQFMISQPIVAAPLVGMALGDWQSGLMLGALLELVWLSELPVGKYIPPDNTAIAVLATGMTVLGGREAGLASPTPMLMLWAVLLSLPLAILAQKADTLVRRYNSGIAARADHAPGDNRHAGCRWARYHWCGIALFFLKSFLATVLLLGSGALALSYLGRLGAFADSPAARFFLEMLPLAGAALWLVKAGASNGMAVFVAGFSAAYLFGVLLGLPWLLVVVMVIAGSMAYSFWALRA